MEVRCDNCGNMGASHLRVTYISPAGKRRRQIPVSKLMSTLFPNSNFSCLDSSLCSLCGTTLEILFGFSEFMKLSKFSHIPFFTALQDIIKFSSFVLQRPSEDSIESGLDDAPPPSNCKKMSRFELESQETDATSEGVFLEFVKVEVDVNNGLVYEDSELDDVSTSNQSPLEMNSNSKDREKDIGSEEVNLSDSISLMKFEVDGNNTMAFEMSELDDSSPSKKSRFELESKETDYSSEGVVSTLILPESEFVKVEADVHTRLEYEDESCENNQDEEIQPHFDENGIEYEEVYIDNLEELNEILGTAAPTKKTTNGNSISDINCPACGLYFGQDPTMCSLGIHILNVHRNLKKTDREVFEKQLINHYCSICDIWILNSDGPNSLNSHCRKMHTVRNDGNNVSSDLICFTCNKCNGSFRIKSSHEQHNRQCQGSMEGNGKRKAKSQQDNIEKCPVCNIRYSSGRSLDTHILNVHRDYLPEKRRTLETIHEDLYCNICDIWVLGISLDNHKIQTHRVLTKSLRDMDYIQINRCKLCNGEFRLKEMYKTHIKFCKRWD